MMRRGEVKQRGKWRDFPTDAHRSQIPRLRASSSLKSCTHLHPSPTAFSLPAEFRPRTTCPLPFQSPPGNENLMLLKQPGDPPHKVRPPAPAVFHSWPQLFWRKRCNHTRDDYRSQWPKILNSIITELD